jgi:hypothetical protein
MPTELTHRPPGVACLQALQISAYIFETHLNRERLHGRTICAQHFSFFSGILAFNEAAV